MRGLRLLLTIICILFIYPTIKINAGTTENAEKDPVTSVGLEDIMPNKDNTEVKLSYVLEDNKDIIIKTDVDKVIDVEALKKELGTQKVKENTDKKELQLTLDNTDAIDFKMLVNNKKAFKMSVLKPDGELIFDYDFNKPEAVAENLDDDDDPTDDRGWTKTDTLRISEGPILKHADGSSTRPYLYFGDYLQASSGTFTLDSAWAPRGESRYDSLTSPGSALLYAEPGSDILRGPKADKNHVYTTHYGDNQSNDFGNTNHNPKEEETTPFGVPTSFTSNTLFNFVVNTDNKYKPGTSGPNKLGKAYASLYTPKLYYRVNPKTGFEEQRLVFSQRAYWERKPGKANPTITTVIKQSFTPTGKVVTNITYKNTGHDTMPSFTGLSNHDLSLNKDGAEITDNGGKKIGNYIPMRSLGNERGMYMQATNNEIRTSIFMNQPNAPAGWAARSGSRSNRATKGYLYNPGLTLGAVPITETYYPWKVGKGKGNWVTGSNFYDRKKGQWYFGYVPEKLHNAFNDRSDEGDKGSKLSAGTRLAVSESENQWDAGVTMRTIPIDLEPNQSLQLEYATLIDVPGSTFDPVFDIDKKGSEDNPNIIPQGTKELKISGHWYDFDSQNVTMFYGLDGNEEDDMNYYFVDKQNAKQAANGQIHEFPEKVTKINIQDLEVGLHKVYFVMKDGDENESSVEEYVFRIVKPATDEPQIDVTSPTSTKKKPHNPFSDKMTLTGIWSDKDSKSIKSISYQIDDGPEKIYSENLTNENLGSLNPWKIEDIDISNCNDFKLHSIKFKIIDDKDNEGFTKFFFKHLPGSMHLVAPEEIDFGQVSITPTSNHPIKPNMNDGRVILEDYREKDSNPVGINLTIDKFYKAKKDEDHDDGDGDDSNNHIDGDKVKEATEKESLVHDIYWQNKLINSQSLNVGQTNGPKNDEWQQITDFTDEITQKLKINFRSAENGSSLGKYVSHWTWNTVDSIENKN